MGVREAPRGQAREEGTAGTVKASPLQVAGAAAPHRTQPICRDMRPSPHIISSKRAHMGLALTAASRLMTHDPHTDVYPQSWQTFQ